MKKSAGFSVLETITIVGILSVLGAVLFPVFGEDKTAVDKAACISNLKQLGTAWSLYAQDNNGLAVEATYVVPGRNYAGGCGGWYERLIPYLKDQGTSHVLRGSDPNRGAGAKVTSPTTLECPADPSPYWGISFGMPYAFSSVHFGKDARHPAPIPVKNISVPAKSVILVDATNLIVIPNAESWKGTRPESRHSGSADCLFADGHTGQIAFPSDLSELTASGRRLHLDPYATAEQYEGYSL